MRLGFRVPGVGQRRRRCFMLAVAGLLAATPGWAMPRFGRPGVYPVDGSPVGIGAAAIDAQSGRDLVTANEAGAEGPSLSMLFNRGSGSFFAEQRVGVSTATDILQAFAVGDFNGDGRGDVAIAVDDASALPVHAAVLVYLNNGNNGFAAPTRYPLSGFFPRCLGAADVNEDGALDLIVCHARSVGGAAEGLVTVLSGLRTGTTPNGRFQQTFSGSVGTAPAAAVAGDVDADGRIDLVVVDVAAQRVFIVYGTGSGAGLGSATLLDDVAQPVAALINVVPEQPLPQILVASATGGLLRYAQPSARAFAAPAVQVIALLPRTMGLADADADGIDDLIVVSGLGAELWYGETAGTFRFGESITSDGTLDALTLADLNGDGRLDVAASASTQDRVTVVLNGADVPFTPAPTATITQTPTRTGTPTPTAPRTPGGTACAGDCDRNDSVAVNELVQGVNIALGNASISLCPAFDLDGDGTVTVNELIAGVNSALNGCAGTAR